MPPDLHRRVQLVSVSLEVCLVGHTDADLLKWGTPPSS